MKFRTLNDFNQISRVAHKLCEMEILRVSFLVLACLTQIGRGGNSILILAKILKVYKRNLIKIAAIKSIEKESSNFSLVF